MVYFIEAVGAGLVKIGFTDGDPMDRLRQLQTGSAHQLRLMHASGGSQRREKLLHARFAHLRQSGEWFRLAVEIEVFIYMDREYTPVINSLTDRIEKLEEVARDQDVLDAGCDFMHEQLRECIEDIRAHLGLKPAFGKVRREAVPATTPTNVGG